MFVYKIYRSESLVLLVYVEVSVRCPEIYLFILTLTLILLVSFV